MNPTVAATAIGRPIAADVATAVCTLTLHRVMNGTARNAPPVPTMPATTPMPAPTANSAPLPGSSRVALGGLLRSMRSAVSQMKLPKIAAISDSGSALAICGPISEPITRPGAIARTIGHSTAPRA